MRYARRPLSTRETTPPPARLDLPYADDHERDLRRLGWVLAVAVAISVVLFVVVVAAAVAAPAGQGTAPLPGVPGAASRVATPGTTASAGVATR